MTEIEQAFPVETARLRIVCKTGLSQDAYVEVDGKVLDGVTSVRWSLDAGGVAHAVVDLEMVETDVTLITERQVYRGTFDKPGIKTFSSPRT